jgi:protein-tyrosine phosphatase
MSGLLDIHSHVVPGVDDGAATLEEALEMLAEARRAGVAVLYATPHVDGDDHPWTLDRRLRIADRFAELAEHSDGELELQLGYEVTPTAGRMALDEDPGIFALPGLEAVLVDGPDDEPAAHDALITPYVERIAAAGLRAIVAHPERAAAHPVPVRNLAERLREAGALLQVDAGALLGADGPLIQESAWAILRGGLCDLLASDAHEASTFAQFAAAHAALRHEGVLL